MISQEMARQPWFLLEKLHQYPPLFLVPPMLSMATELSELGFENIVFSINEYIDGNVNMYFRKDDWDKAARATFEALKNNPGLLGRLHKESDEEVVPKLRDLSWQMVNEPLSGLSTDELTALFKKWYALNGRLHFIRSVGWLVETPAEYFSAYLIGYLRDLIQKQGLNLDPILTFSTLTNPTKFSVVNFEHIALLKLAQQVQAGTLKLSADEPAIQAHARQYACLPFGCVGPAWTAADIVKHIDEILHAGISIDINKQIQEQEAQMSAKEKDQKELYQKLSVDDIHRHLLQVAKDIVYQKSWSKEHQYLSWYAAEFLLREVAKRLYITVPQSRYFLDHELIRALRSGSCDVDMLNERQRYGLLGIDKNGATIFVGNEARSLQQSLNIIKEENVIDQSQNEFMGQVAVPGSARGVVKIINKTSEMNKMQPGDILVSEMTIPEIVGAMKKAAAIVTDMGGITCHAAIVSRELGIPCVIGTKIATKLLKDGDMVEVDATAGCIKRVTV